MKKSFLTKLAFGFLMAAFAVGCAQDSSKSSSSSRRGYCDPNSYNCSSNYSYGNQYGNNYNTGCGMNAVSTSYGCLPRGNCPVNYGYSMQTNQCIPAQGGYNTGYNNTGYNNYNNGYYNNGYNNGYNNYNNGYYNNGYYGY
ncbi:MAG: hypothetical protein RJB66_339 [Pseudomonadota bacterium]